MATCRVRFMTLDFSRRDASTSAREALFPLLQHLKQSLGEAREWERTIESLYLEWREQQLAEYESLRCQLEQIAQRLGADTNPGEASHRLNLIPAQIRIAVGD